MVRVEMRRSLSTCSRKAGTGKTSETLRKHVSYSKNSSNFIGALIPPSDVMRGNGSGPTYV